MIATASYKNLYSEVTEMVLILQFVQIAFINHGRGGVPAHIEAVCCKKNGTIFICDLKQLTVSTGDMF